MKQNIAIIHLLYSAIRQYEPESQSSTGEAQMGVLHLIQMFLYVTRDLLLLTQLEPPDAIVSRHALSRISQIARFSPPQRTNHGSDTSPLSASEKEEGVRSFEIATKIHLNRLLKGAFQMNTAYATPRLDYRQALRGTLSPRLGTTCIEVVNYSHSPQGTLCKR